MNRFQKGEKRNCIKCKRNCIKRNKNRKLKNPKISYIFEKTLVLSIFL